MYYHSRQCHCGHATATATANFHLCQELVPLLLSLLQLLPLLPRAATATAIAPAAERYGPPLLTAAAATAPATATATATAAERYGPSLLTAAAAATPS